RSDTEETLQDLKMDNQTAALLASAACGLGALLVLMRSASKHRHPSSDSAAILSLSLPELTKQLRENLLSPEDVFYSYMEKTLAVHKKLNCCTEVLLESFDQLKRLGSNKDGLLYGVPISIKDNVAYKNHDCTCGLIVNLDQPAEKDGVIVEVLKKQGAIPFVKTNLPQALLNYDCSNPIFGQTVNPYNAQKTSGGSSGGEGADSGACASVRSMVASIAGTSPLLCFTVSSQGIVPVYRGQKSVLSSPGPLARDVDSLALCMQALLCDHMFSLDPTVPPLPFNLQVCLLLNSCSFLLSRFAVQYENSNIIRSWWSHCFCFRKGGPLEPCLKPQVQLYSLPNWLKRTLKFLLKPFVSSLWKQHAAVEDYISETIAHWRKHNIDVLLCPMIGPAFNFLYCGKLTCLTSLTMLYNLLNFPAGAVPVSTVTAQDEEDLEHFRGNYQDQWDKLHKQVIDYRLKQTVKPCLTFYLSWQGQVRICLTLSNEVKVLFDKDKLLHHVCR
uniref:Amidase domain-containing protein n=1 Tax=Fundulus heteroclitus TaxID=8078 RepID=A0A3Q2Q4R1_FUNHE